MKKGWYLGLGLAVGFGLGIYGDSQFQHYNFFNKVNKQIMDNIDNLDEKNCEENIPKSRLNDKLELSVIDLDRVNKEVSLMGGDGKEYLLKYDEVLLKGVISEKKFKDCEK
jgi:hypothetical protein